MMGGFYNKGCKAFSSARRSTDPFQHGGRREGKCTSHFKVVEESRGAGAKM